MSKTRHVSTWLERNGWTWCGGTRWRTRDGDYMEQNEAIAAQNRADGARDRNEPITFVGPITVRHDDAGSPAAHRFMLPGSRNLKLAAGERLSFRYDHELCRWVVADVISGLEPPEGPL